MPCFFSFSGSGELPDRVVYPGRGAGKDKATVKPNQGGKDGTGLDGSGKDGDGKATVKPDNHGQKGGEKGLGIQKATVKPAPDVYRTDDMLMTEGPYYSIRTSRSQLDGNEVVMGETMYPKRMEGGFDAGDTRIKQTMMRYRMDTHANITASFNPADMICRGCKNRGPHSVIGGEDQHPVVLVVTDQNFPPVMFSEDEGACIGVVRVEFGSIREIGFIIGDLLDGVRLPDGSVILVSSVSDLDRQGVIGYAEELARTIRIVKEKQGGRVQVSAMPPVLIAGINSFKLLRDILEVEFWIERLEGGDGMMLGRMREKMIQKIGERGIGRRRSPDEHQHTLPKGVGVWDKIRAGPTCRRGWSP
jgi:hypothetical protein